MTPSSRTPEGIPNRCPVCGHDVVIDESGSARDATCPYCGSLLWMDRRRSVGSVEEAREHVARLAREIEQLARTAESVDALLSGFLHRLVVILGARAAAIWQLDGHWLSQLSCHSADDEMLAELRTPEHAQLLFRSAELQEEQSVVRALLRTVDGFINPTGCVLLFSRFSTPLFPRGLVEILQRPDAPEEAFPGYLQFIAQMAGHLAHSPVLQQK